MEELIKEPTEQEKELAEILKDASILHEDLRNYGSLKDIDKPLVVSGILLALREVEYKNFSIDELTGDTINTDGEKIFNAIKNNLTRSRVAPEVKRDKILSQFSIIKDTQILNEINTTLNKTPLKHFVEFLDRKIYKSIRYTKSSEDYLGRFYGEFMSYSGGDGQTLGIVLTPKHITDLFCDLVDIQKDDVVLDPCSGTAGFLIASMHHMLEQATTDNERKDIKQKQLHGFELQPYMFTIATTNMILRGDGKSNLINENFLNQDTNKLQLKQATIGMMNPPYAQGSKQNPDLYEISFTEHLLDSLAVGARAIVIVPQSSMTGKTKEEKNIKQNILKKHTLEGVITLNKDTFYGVGTMPCIAIFTAWEKHSNEKVSKFIDFKDDGFKVSPHIGLVETEQAKDKKQHLLDVWFKRQEARNNFCVKTNVKSDDEWLHSFYYFNDEIPTDNEFEQTISDFLTFQYQTIMNNRGYLFDNKKENIESKEIKKLSQLKWKEFYLSGENGIFENFHGKRLTKTRRRKGTIPLLTAGEQYNGVADFISNKDMKILKDVISIDMFGNTFYHNYSCTGDDNIYFFKNDNLSQYIKLFIIELIKKNKSKFSYGKQFRQNNADTLKILLPINEQNEPDYEYIEQYIINLKLKKIKQYSNFFKSK